MDQGAHEYGPLIEYLNWLTWLPWGVTSQDTLDLPTMRRVLDEQHWGLSEVKQRLAEFMAAAQLSGSLQGKILLLTGPPGTGKVRPSHSHPTLTRLDLDCSLPRLGSGS